VEIDAEHNLLAQAEFLVLQTIRLSLIILNIFIHHQDGRKIRIKKNENTQTQNYKKRSEVSQN